MTAAPHMAEALRMISAEAKEDNSVLGRSVYKALATCGEVADMALAAIPAPDEKDAEIDIAAIEVSNKRWHGLATDRFSVRWEPYKPDGQRQMKAKGRWQRAVGSGDYWRWVNCDRPNELKPETPT